MAADDGFQGVSNCYVFKSRLQEYAQKVKITCPTYETIKEGPSHDPSFRSTVIVNNVRYDSLPGFSSRKSAEQSAAEVALLALANSGAMDGPISQPVHEMGLCKNLLQEYAQKMNYAMPFYECKKDEKSGKNGFFTCTVDIGGMKYIGTGAKSKKEAELKAARTALLAIRSAPSTFSTKPNDSSEYTVVPVKKKETATALQPKKEGHFKKKLWKKKRPRERKNCDRDKINGDNLGTNIEGQAQAGLEASQTDAAVAQVTGTGVQPMESIPIQDEGSKPDGNDGEPCAERRPLNPYAGGDFLDGRITELDSHQIDLGSCYDGGISSMVSEGNFTDSLGQVNKFSEVEQLACAGDCSSKWEEGEVPYGSDAGKPEGRTVGV